ncbi:hypothetical protein ACER0C_005657 [Sarotherodon galilaeus]
MTGVNNDEGGWMLASFFAPQNWTEGLDREFVLNMVSFFYPDPKAAFIRDVIADEYIGNGDDCVKNRDGFTEMLGDLFFTIPVIKAANYHRDPCPEDEGQLNKIMMSYWGNFPRTGSPNGHNLVHWPKYGVEEKYLAIGLKKQVTAQHLKKERFVFLTQTVPEKIKQQEENAERSEL